MKNLRQLMRRYRNKSSGQSHPARRSRRAETTQRRLTTEALERRELLAAGVMENHNPWNQFDVNNDRAITARDALGVINYLGRGESEQAAGDGDRMFYDVNGDNQITAADALGVINAIGRGEGMEEPIVELLLTARQYGADPGAVLPFDDDLIAADGNGEINVEIGDIFDLEIAYDDLRGFGARLGAFQLIVNLVADQNDVLEPVLFETQRVVIDQAIETVPFADRGNTSITLSIPNSPPDISGALTNTSTWTAFSQSPQTEVRNALNAFGYTNDQFFLSTPSGIGDDTGIEIHWTDLAFADIDLPNITVEVNEAPAAAEIPTDSTAIPPDPTDPESIATNLNVFSRTFKGNEPFYDSNKAGQFDPLTGSFTGLRGIGGIPSAGGGIPQLAGNDGYPPGDFDAFSLAMRAIKATQGNPLQVSVTATETESVLVYGIDEPVDPNPAAGNSVIIEGLGDADVLGNGRATIVINVTDPNAVDPPVAADGSMPAFNEGSSGEVDLSSGFLSGGAPTTVTASSANLPGTVNVGPGPNYTLTYTPVDDDENSNGTITYTATNDGGSNSGTISVTINPINDAPVAFDDDGPFPVVSGTPITLTHAQLTGNDDPGEADETGDPLTAIPVGGSSANGGTISAVAGGIQYSAPGGGFTGTDTFTYRVNDGSVDSANTATVTVNVSAVAVDPPVAADGSMPAFDEGSSGAVNLSGLLSGGAPTTVTASSANLPGTVNVGPGPNYTLTYTPVDDDENSNGTITYTATNDGGSNSGTISVTINPINDAPVAVNDPGPFQVVAGTPITLTHAQLTGNDDPGAADESGDPLTAIPVGGSSANGGTISAVAGGIQYSAPGGGFTGTDTFTYRVNDGSVDSANTATVTVNVSAVAVDPPTAADGSIPAFNEGATGSLNLSGLLGGGVPTSVIVSDQGLLGTASIGAGPNFTLTYTPSDINNFGADSIEYTASNSGGSDTGTISITINRINDAPVADNETLSTPENTPLPISFSTLLNGDTVGPANEIPLDTLSITIVNDPLNPLASLDQNGNLTYNPPPDFFGTDSFTYEITDGSPDGALQATGTVTINITEGPNNVPVVDGPLSQSFSEDDGPTTITQADMLFGASDEDDDTLIVRNLVRTSGDAAGISIVGNTLSVTPGANGSLTDGTSANAVFSYEVFDGQAAVGQTITITINGENDPPSTGPIDDITTFTDSDPVVIDVLAVADAGSGENQPLSISGASLSNPAAGAVTFNGMIFFTPDPGFEGDVTVNYEISDGDASDTGSVEVSVVDFVPSIVSGYVFIDRMENVRAVREDDADPFRDGRKDSNEQGLGGIPLNLVSDEMTWTTYTDLNGHYEFDNIAPGSYTLMYDPIPNAIPGPFVPMTIDIGPAGGEMVEINIPLLGLDPQVTGAGDMLARAYLNGASTVSTASNGGREGLVVSLDSSGASNFVMAGEGFDNVKYADVRTIDDSDTDAALLTVLQENGDVLSALVPRENATPGPDGSLMRVFGGIEDLPFLRFRQGVSTVEEFHMAVDEILGDIE